MDNVIIENTLTSINETRFIGYLCHAYCYKGYCTFTFRNIQYNFQVGDCLIVIRGDLITDIKQSSDFEVDAIYVTQEFIELSTPQSNYGMKGHLALFENPIMKLTPEMQKVCMLNFNYIKERLTLTKHHFHREVMINAIQCMIIDFFDFHAELYGNNKISNQYAQIINKFLSLLEQGDYVEHRDVSYYANKLCITSKYLSEVTKQVSGFSANYWITRYTALEISRQLRNKNLTISDISDNFNFSSLSYFTRYVQKHLGAKPSELKK